MKKILAIAAAGLLAAHASADYLLWQVDQTTTANATPFMYAAVAAHGPNGDEKAGLANTEGTEIPYVLWVDYSDTAPMGLKTEETYTDLGAYGSGSYYFMVELYNSENVLVGTSQKLTLADLQQHIYANMGLTGITPYVVNSISPVPEPTGGLLVLLGAGLLGLKRRRV